MLLLQKLMEGVTQQGITPETVQAACNCAARMNDILRTHIEFARLQQQRKP